MRIINLFFCLPTGVIVWIVMIRMTEGTKLTYIYSNKYEAEYGGIYTFFVSFEDTVEVIINSFIRTSRI